MSKQPPLASDPQVAIWDIHQPVGRRSMLLAAAASLIGLAIAGYGLFTAQGTRTAAVPAEDAALVNNVPILRADLIAQITALYSVPLAQTTLAQRQKVLEDMIREELYVQRGIEMGLSNDDIDVRQALVQATEGQIAQDAMTSKPAEDELATWYGSHMEKYASEGLVTLHEWLVPRGSDGQQAVAALRKGAAPASLGLKTTGRVDDGEEFYFAAEQHLGEPLFAIARKMEDGTVSAPIPMPDGLHILQMIRNKRPVTTPYAQARDQVLADFLADKVARLQAGNQRFLKKRADIKIASDLK
ncbi:peptidyl-prolyl cis-trans isomerase [Novosphingobium sp. FKTRR1]|uniref:peptidylprolyl isomerase n=1 Tax=Novosphingobium sp. FKTRR1 TaxID=2879118 RepID=UPI001CEFD344|nr:peptidyl-prolyl cis-trans isomerase [Novosphingobium sp. FKTRR1]